MREKRKSTSPSATQVKKMEKDNRYWKEIKRNTPIWKRWTVDTCRNVRLAHSSYVQFVIMLISP